MKYKEIYQKAIDIYGKENLIHMIYEEMCELGVALSKYRRKPGAKTLRDICEEIADVQIMITQAKLMFGESEVQKFIDEKTNRLKRQIEEKEEIELIYAKHQFLSTKVYKWVNPNNVDLTVGDIVFAETKYGEKPVIVTKKSKVAKKFEGNYKKILRNANSTININVSTKPKFRLEDYKYGKYKYVMHCDTEEKAEVFCKYLHDNGKAMYLNYTYWTIFNKSTCYNFNTGTYADIIYYENKGCQILEFDDFDWEE